MSNDQEQTPYGVRNVAKVTGRTPLHGLLRLRTPFQERGGGKCGMGIRRRQKHFSGQAASLPGVEKTGERAKRRGLVPLGGSAVVRSTSAFALCASAVARCAMADKRGGGGRTGEDTRLSTRIWQSVTRVCKALQGYTSVYKGILEHNIQHPTSKNKGGARAAFEIAGGRIILYTNLCVGN
jgi:hypothetical protein